MSGFSCRSSTASTRSALKRGIAPLPKITPHALRRTYISLMLEAGAPLPYVMDQVGHADSKTTLEIHAQVQKRVSRKNVHAAFDRLLNGADSDVAPAAIRTSHQALRTSHFRWRYCHVRWDRDGLLGRALGHGCPRSEGVPPSAVKKSPQMSMALAGRPDG
ncbi:MAG: tyrosine-type recombinase/integrase [Solirubrobacteraceae bacterium]